LGFRGDLWRGLEFS